MKLTIGQVEIEDGKNELTLRNSINEMEIIIPNICVGLVQAFLSVAEDKINGKH